ncbi:FAD-dependent oxidoreductase [Vreelandella rituensis]|uniref:FAD-dependent oxidoreductase n=1 Tax=Vreelandella rituensis TaxID=2282306 RepID=A0A368U8M3_9GAMM|nr:FAD-dependent oxidoreductase [Halomonas rituensis]RCV93529.1 FAD-dependent oxidoreductase [Halomonas rituensis]
MHASNHPLVIVGSGMAGVGLVRALRKLDTQRPITLVSRDSGSEYSKPLLSTGFAKGLSPESLAVRSAFDLATQLDIDVLPHTSVTTINVAQRTLLFADNRQQAYTDLVLATGAAPRVPFAIPEALTSRLFTINDLDDYHRFHTALSQINGSARVAIIGAGLVGCEFANDLHAAGHQVRIIAPEAAPLPRLLPPPLGKALGNAFVEAGIHLELGRTITELALSGNDVSIRLDNADTVTADIVLMATGLVPRIELAQRAGIHADDSGIHVDRTLQTSQPGIYALGDAACVDGVNAMYVQPLQASAKALAATLSGTPTTVSFGAWPVIVKTPLLPVVALPPLQRPARWRIEGEEHNFSALAEDKDGRLIGFALTGSCVRRKVELSRAAPALLG